MRRACGAHRPDPATRAPRHVSRGNPGLQSQVDWYKLAACRVPHARGLTGMTGMPTVDQRIRRARAMAGLTQQGLAERIGVQRGAVAQWESPTGCMPSMEHMVAIATVTSTSLEWLGTGRGEPRKGLDVVPADAEHLAQDEIEVQCLRTIRRMPRRLREQVLSILVAIAR